MLLEAKPVRYAPSQAWAPWALGHGVKCSHEPGLAAEHNSRARRGFDSL